MDEKNPRTLKRKLSVETHMWYGDVIQVPSVLLAGIFIEVGNREVNKYEYVVNS